MSIYPESQLGIWLNTPIKFLETTAGCNLRAARNDASWRNAANDCDHAGRSKSTAKVSLAHRAASQPCHLLNNSAMARQCLSTVRHSRVPPSVRGSLISRDRATQHAMADCDSSGIARLLDPAIKALQVRASMAWRCLRHFTQKP